MGVARGGVAWVIVLLGVSCGGSVDDSAQSTAGGSGRSGSGGTEEVTGGSAGSSGGTSGTSGGTAGTLGAGGSGGSGGSADASPHDSCDLPLEVGPCNAAIPRFHYDPASAKCVEFVYGGCGGNTNNFTTELECATVCQHKVISCVFCSTPQTCMETEDCSYCPKSLSAAERQPCGQRGQVCKYGFLPHSTNCLCADATEAGPFWLCSILL
jgi:hypothetical protein